MMLCGFSTATTIADEYDSMVAASILPRPEGLVELRGICVPREVAITCWIGGQ
jgi:hypothetical protein